MQHNHARHSDALFSAPLQKATGALGVISLEVDLC